MKLYLTRKLSKNKAFELESFFWKDMSNLSNYFNFWIEWSYKGDHAGFTINLEILTFYFNFKVYDIRHWDYDNNCYEKE